MESMLTLTSLVCVWGKWRELDLNILLDTMQSTIRHEFTEAVVTYEEKPREPVDI